MNPAAMRTSLAILVLSLWAGLASADPPGLTTLPIGADAPDFRLPGVDGKTYTLQDFAAREGPGRGLHLQPLPDGPGV